MPGPLPKDPAVRQRRNKALTRATLKVEDHPITRAPSLPKRTDGQAWHPLTRAWWHDVWHSPMAGEYLQADVHGLYRIAALVDKFWLEPNERTAMAIAHQEQRYGLNPLDRRRLEWIVERAEQDAPRRPELRPMDPADDPRNVLRIVS